MNYRESSLKRGQDGAGSLAGARGSVQHGDVGEFSLPPCSSNVCAMINRDLSAFNSVKQSKIFPCLSSRKKKIIIINLIIKY